MSKKTDGTYTGNPRIHIRIDKEIFKILSNESEKEGISISEKARLFIIKALKESELLKDY